MQQALDELRFAIDMEELRLLNEALKNARTMMPPWPGPGFHEAYEKGEEIGDGAFAKVYKCTRKADGAQFAVKEVLTKSLKPKEELQMIQEAETIRKLKHPNILQVIDFFKEEEAFVVRHFAGNVCYMSAGFMDKNNDASTC